MVGHVTFFPSAAAHRSRALPALRRRQQDAALRAAVAGRKLDGLTDAACRRRLGLAEPARLRAAVVRTESAVALRRSRGGRLLVGGCERLFGSMRYTPQHSGVGLLTVLAFAPAVAAALAGGAGGALAGAAFGLLTAWQRPSDISVGRHVSALATAYSGAAALSLGAATAACASLPLASLCAALGVVPLLGLDLLAAAAGLVSRLRRAPAGGATAAAVADTARLFVRDDGVTHYDAAELAAALTRRGAASTPATADLRGRRPGRDDGLGEADLSAAELARLVAHPAVAPARRPALVAAVLALPTHEEAAAAAQEPDFLATQMAAVLTSRAAQRLGVRAGHRPPPAAPPAAPAAAAGDHVALPLLGAAAGGVGEVARTAPGSAPARAQVARADALLAQHRQTLAQRPEWNGALAPGASLTYEHKTDSAFVCAGRRRQPTGDQVAGALAVHAEASEHEGAAGGHLGLAANVLVDGKMVAMEAFATFGLEFRQRPATAAERAARRALEAPATGVRPVRITELRGPDA